MKRFLSIMLCVMMLVSVFSIGASAMVPTSYEVVTSPAVAKDDYLPLQNFSNVAEEDAKLFTDVIAAGTATIEAETDGSANAVLKLATAETGAAAVPFDASMKSTKLTQADTKMTIEFKVKPSVNTETLTVAVRMPYLRNLVDTNYSTKANYSVGYAIYGSTFTANEWNTVKIEIDIPEGYAFSTNPAYPEAGNANSLDSATITVNSTTLTNKRSGVSTATKDKYHVATTTFGSTSYISEEEDPLVAVGVARTNPTTTGVNTYLFDDIEVYKPGVPAVTEDVAYPITSGNIYLTKAEALTFAGTGSTTATSGKLKLKEYALTTNCTAPESVITVELKNTVAGGPLTIHYGKTDGAKADGSGNGTGVGAVNIASNDKIGRGWATYKIHFRQTSYNDPYKVYRKGENEATYTELTYGTDWNMQRSGGTDRNKIIFFYQTNALGSFGVADENTVWEMRNLQITDLYTFTGKAVAEDNELTVSLNTMLNKSADVIVATYDGSKLANVSYVPYTRFADTAEVTVPYTTGNTVKLFIWDGIATGVPVLSNPIPITVQ